MQPLDVYLRNFAAADSEAALRQAFTDALAEHDVNIYNYGAGTIHASEGATVDRIWSTLPADWIERYRARNYQRWDRLVREAFQRTTPFTYADVFSTPPETPEQAEMETQFPWRNGMVVPIHSPVHRFGVLSAAFDSPVVGVDQGGSDFVARLALLAGAMHERAEALSRRTDPEARLSDREVQCLTWAARGKTSVEIAVILGITERTVRKHVGAAMGKLSVSSRAQAVARALALGVIPF